MKILRPLLPALLLLAAPLARPAELSDLIKDTQKLVHDPGKIVMVWWVPTEFWALSLKNDPRVTEAQKTEFTTVLSKYVVFIVVAGDFGPMAALQVKSRDDVVAHTELRVHGEVVPLLPPADISKSATNLVAMMKPLMANMLGAMGQGLEFLLYSNEKNGAPLIDPLKPGEFTYTAYGQNFLWRLPLGSLMPPKIDAVTKEEFPGNYIFNPFTGSKLILKDAPAQK